MKGLFRTFEVIISIIIIMFAFIFFYTNQNIIVEFDGNYEKIGIESLKTLDYGNQLHYYTLKNDTESIRNLILPNFPPIVDIFIQICDINCNVPTLNAKETKSIHYFISGSPNNINNREIILFVLLND